MSARATSDWLANTIIGLEKRSKSHRDPEIPDAAGLCGWEKESTGLTGVFRIYRSSHQSCRL
jgi:hypothetical protein